MIKKENTLPIGKLIKPHGLRGELSFEFSTDIFKVEAPYFICDIEGILVPFFIESYHLRGNNSGFIKFEGVDSNEDAKELSGVSLYLERTFLPADFSLCDVQGLEFYVGYQITDQDGNKIGEIISIDDSTENILFNVLSDAKNEILIPASDDYILELNDEEGIIRMDIPEGLLGLN